MGLRYLAAACLASLLAACASQPPGMNFPKAPSSALEQPEATRLGRTFAQASRHHAGKSGFRLIASGVDGIIARVQMADAAERTLDLQYYIYRQDDTSKLLSEAILRAADRGVRVRVLLDDHGAIEKELVAVLDAHPQIEVRLFNPFAYRGDSRAARFVELALHAPRLKHRMHNKLFVADNAIALVGGRNIGDEYFEAHPEFGFGDYDVFVGGPIVPELSRSFDDYWASAPAIPVRALQGAEFSRTEVDKIRETLEAHRRWMKDTDHMRRVSSGEPLAGMMAGTQLHWARAHVISDRPAKARPDNGETDTWLTRGAVAEAAASVRSELLIVSPYFIPDEDGMRLIMGLRERGVRVRILTNSLEATDVSAVHAGYARHRPLLLRKGVGLYEARASLNGVGGSGSGSALLSSGSGRFSLHAKAFVFDREKVLIGSMNFDRRSLRINTELGILIESPELARQVARQFDDIARPANSYEVVLDRNTDHGFGPAALKWRTEEGGKITELETEPIRSVWQRVTVDLLLFLPLDVVLGESELHWNVSY